MWQAAELLIGALDPLIDRARPVAANSASHLERSGESVLFNTAEGIGAFQPKVKIVSYEVAKREANEVRAILRRLDIRKIFTALEIKRAYDLAGAVIGMLTRAIIALQKRDA